MRRKNTVVSLLLLAAFASLALPIMSVTCLGSESGTILVRIFNLVEFSIAGVVTLLAPVLLLLTVFVQFPRKGKRLTALGIFMVDAVCTAIAGRSAYTWLAEIGTESVRFHPVCAVYGLLILTAVFVIDNPDHP